MASAALLAKLGKRVLVLEQHHRPGGWCHSFERKGFKFSPGVHYLGELGAEVVAVTGHEVRAEVTLEAEDSYGEPDPALLMKVPADVIPEDARQVGREIDGEAEDGSSSTCRVVAIDAEGITVDGNHPLAGQALNFKLELVEIS